MPAEPPPLAPVWTGALWMRYGCDRCGAPVRAVEARFDSVIGYVVFRQHYRTDGFLCAVCVDAVYDEHQSRLCYGWFSVVSLLGAPVDAFTNRRMRAKAARAFAEIV